MLWYKVKKAQFKLFCAKASKEIKKLAVAVVLGEMLVVGCYYYITSVNYWGLFDTKTINVYVKETALKAEAKDNVSVLVDYVHYKESGRGTAKVGLNATCAKRGLSNEYGYNPPVCYASNEVVKSLVVDFIKSHIADGFTEKETLCIYNTGMSRNGVCDYVSEL
jgi:hypothetical protein